jgi:hypothetical protein
MISFKAWLVKNICMNKKKHRSSKGLITFPLKPDLSGYCYQPPQPGWHSIKQGLLFYQ